MDAFYDESARNLRGHLDAGRTVVVLAEGDPSSMARSCTSMTVWLLIMTARSCLA